MFQTHEKTTLWHSAVAMTVLVYHVAVRQVRKSNGNAVKGLILLVAQNLIMIAAFYALAEFLSMRSAKIRGDLILFVMSGVFMFMTHTKAIAAVASSAGAASSIMKHGPMNTLVVIFGNALGALYSQVFALCVILFVYHAAFMPITIYDPVGAMGMVLLSWASGVAIGVIFLGVKPWAPNMIGILQQTYTRINMFASGKMFLANSTPGVLRQFFDWNPLFHTIDQGRGFTFINYSPHYTSISYPLILTLVLFTVGLMGEFFTRQHVSASWSARN